MIKLKELRTEKGITQIQLAKIIKISNQSISGYETGYAQPPIEELIKIADYFEVSTDYLLGRSNDIGIVELKNEITENEQRLIACYRSLDRAHQIALLDFAVTFSNTDKDNIKK